jgi:hypothetical protein
MMQKWEEKWKKLGSRRIRASGDDVDDDDDYDGVDDFMLVDDNSRPNDC